MDHDLDTARHTSASREAFLDQHAPVQRRLDEIDDILDDRVDRAVRRAVNDPPAYLTRTLGPLPTDGEPVGAWIDAATIIESYRLEHSITDRTRVLGPRPSDPAAQALRRQVLHEVAEAMAPHTSMTEVLEVGVDLDL